MASESGLRRSSRKRKVISYKDLGNTPEVSDESETTSIEKQPGKKKRPRKGTGTEETSYIPPPEKSHTDSKSLGTYAKSRGSRLNAVAGTDESARQAVLSRMDKWKNVLDKVPEELLDYTIGWGVCIGDWKEKGGDRQRSEILHSDSSGVFRPLEKSLNLSMGPQSEIKVVQLAPYDVIQSSSLFAQRRGYTINVGVPVWALDFLPQPPSPKTPQTQYIAIAGHPSLESRPKLYNRDSGLNAIQLWAIAPHSTSSEGINYLATLICHSWGTCWGLKFCPYGAHGEGRVGLLAGVFGDGIVRVIDIRDEWIGSADGTTNVSVSEAAWQYSFGNDNMGTCVSWKSHAEIIIGCSNGFVAIFDLSDDTDDRTIPSLYLAVADTYILSITSLAPSHPYFIATAAFDGAIQVTDIRSPEADAALVLRQRAFASVVAGLPFCGGILSPDEVSGVRYSAFRSLKKGTLLVGHDGPIWDIAASQGGPGAGVHGLVLSAGSDGVCSVSSAPLRLFGTQKRSPRQILFRIEQEGEEFKLKEEFGVSKQDLQSFSSTKIFDDSIAVTKVVWCMNAGFTSWYAAGMGCGLVKIEDLNFR